MSLTSVQLEITGTSLPFTIGSVCLCLFVFLVPVFANTLLLISVVPAG